MTPECEDCGGALDAKGNCATCDRFWVAEKEWSQSDD